MLQKAAETALQDAREPMVELDALADQGPEDAYRADLT